MNCTGNGICLEQIYNNDLDITCRYNCQPIRCVNYEFCISITNASSSYCIECNQHSYGTLEIRDTVSACCICMENKGREVKFPPCSHWFCVDCTKSILWFDETKYNLSPVPFGCPPCPNGCQNPERGPQCDCLVYFLWNGELYNIGPMCVVQAWRTDNPEAYRRWIDADSESIIRGNINGEVWGSCKCPICRRIYKQFN